MSPDIIQVSIVKYLTRYDRTTAKKRAHLEHRKDQATSKPSGISLDAIQVGIVVGTTSGSDGTIDSRTSTWQNIHNIKNRELIGLQSR